MLDIGRSEHEHYEHHYAKWWIYLTHWSLLACTLQAWLAAWIVTQGMMVDRDDFGIHNTYIRSLLFATFNQTFFCFWESPSDGDDVQPKFNASQRSAKYINYTGFYTQLRQCILSLSQPVTGLWYLIQV